jgi:hypothetical protein
MSEPNFSVEVLQNEYLPAGARDVNAIVTITAPDGGRTPGDEAAISGGGRAELIIVDCSGSMDYPHAKIVQARAATAAAIDVIADGVAFAVIAGTQVARPVFPTEGSRRTRRNGICSSRNGSGRPGRALPAMRDRAHGPVLRGMRLRLQRANTGQDGRAARCGGQPEFARCGGQPEFARCGANRQSLGHPGQR